MGHGPSWRLIFIDVDSSFTINDESAAVKGYMVVRSPKGTTEPMYFGPGNAAAIHAMIGIPDANHPDIAEAIAYNNEYGLYISAPPGSEDEYPSYFGGSYLTTNGAFDFYKVSDSDELNFLTAIQVGEEKKQFVTVSAAPTTVISSTADLMFPEAGEGVVAINGVSNSVIGALDHLDFDYWGNADDTSAVAKGVIALTFKITGVSLEIYHGEVQVGSGAQQADGSWNLTLGGVQTQYNTGVMWLDFKQLGDWYKYLGMANLSTDAERKALIQANKTNLYAYVMNGTRFTKDGGVTRTAQATGLVNRLDWVLNIQDKAFAAIHQKSATEKETSVVLQEIGYDKVYYDAALAYIAYADQSKTSFNTGDDNNYVVLLDVNGAPSQVSQFTGVTKGAPVFVDVTSKKFRGKYLRVRNSASSTSVSTLDNTLWYVTSDGKIIQSTKDSNFPPKNNSSFNTITFSCAEEVYPGQVTGGGTFTGSLSETGKDSRGSQIYFPLVLPDTALSFVEVKVFPNVTLDAMDDMMNAYGFWTGTRIVDDYGPEVNSLALTLKGKRYVQHLIDTNVANNMVGCPNADDTFYSTCILGWNEAFNTKYDECSIFMETSGIESLKETLAALRGTQKLSTMISPKVITNAEFLDVDTIAITARLAGTAQYVGEFLVRDPYTGKKYWCMPIGDVGVNLSRIIEKKLGGWAPMWQNITGGLGGQLARSVLKAKWDFSDNDEKLLDEKGLNPITFTADDGLMIKSQKTTQDPTNVTDWSYLGHTMSFDLFKRDMRDNVMRPQIGKPINEYWMGIRQQQADAIMAKRLSGTQPIWSAGKIDIASVNTDTTKAMRKFCIKATVKVTVFSEKVELTFENVGQLTSV